jgi:hypothetical protein
MAASMQPCSAWSCLTICSIGIAGIVACYPGTRDTRLRFYCRMSISGRMFRSSRRFRPRLLSIFVPSKLFHKLPQGDLAQLIVFAHRELARRIREGLADVSTGI